jgi:putative transposase
VRENQTIVIETLKINNMVKNHKLSKSITDASWGMFHQQLAEKANEHGRSLIKIDPYYPSSKTCHQCGTVNNTLTLADRVWVCECGAVLDRDVNACVNLILAAGSAERLNAHPGLPGGNYITGSR